MTDGITVRRCEFHRDVDALLDLFGVVFGQRIDRLVWEWKHRLHPAGGSVSFVAEDAKDKVIAHFGYLPWRMRVAGRELIACQGVDLMVHPDYRRRGLAYELVTACRHQMIEKGWHYTFGFPGRASLHLGLKKIGYTHLLTLPYLTSPSRGLTATTRAARSVRNRMFWFRSSSSTETPGTIRVREIHAFDDTVNLLSRQLSGDNKVVTVRDAEFLNWRFFRHPINRYTVLSAEDENELQGYCVVRGREIVDLQAVDKPEVASCLVAHSVRHIIQQGHDVAGSSFSSQSPGHNFLKNSGFTDSRLKIKSRGLRRRQPVIVLVNPSSPFKKTILDPRVWTLSLSDTDFL